MLTAYDTLSGSIMDIANTAAMDLTSKASQPSPYIPNPGAAVDAGSRAGSSPFLTDILEAARAKAAAEKRKATWLLVGVGLGALVVGLLVGRYVVPAKKKRKG